MKNNYYNKGSYPNRDYSYITYSEYTYIRISSNILKRWNKAIRKGETTILELPRYLVGKLLKGINSRKTIKKTKEENIKDIRGLVININNNIIPILKKLVKGLLRSSFIYLTGNIN